MAIEHGPKHALDVLTRQRTGLLTLLALRRRDGRNKPARSSLPTPGGVTVSAPDARLN